MIKNIEQIIEAADIYNIVADKVELKRSGSGFKGKCPFHDEKSASFMVSPAKGIYKCFGCGKGGNAASFLMEHDKLSFPEAIEKIATREGIEVDYDNSIDRDTYIRETSETKTAREQLKATANRAYAVLCQSSQVSYNDSQEYHLYGGSRSYSKETVEKWGIVLAPNKNILSNNKEINIARLVNLGWIRPSKKNPSTHYDFFKGRILFPIRDTEGNVRGINARLNGVYDKDTKDKTGPKYINSSESLIYNKSKILFGLSQNYREIDQKKFAYLVEGPTDVISLYDQGIKNAVAVCGSALTDHQCKLLARYTDTVVLVVDHDALHKSSTYTAIEKLVAAQMVVKVAELDTGHDPDSYIRTVGAEAWKAYMDDSEHTTDGIMWRVSQMSTESASDKSLAVALATGLVSLIEDNSQRKIYTKQLSTAIGVPVAIFRDELVGKANKKTLKKSSLSPEQELNIKKYNGVYEQGRKYFVKGIDTTYPVSNFVIHPIMLVVARQHSIRLVRITNEYGDSEVMEIGSDDFVMLTAMKKRVESRGSFVFWGKEEQFVKIKRMIYDITPKCFPITKMGLHAEGFFSWGNGITDSTGKFTPVDRYGVVEYNGDKFYLPTFSEVDINVKSDDDDHSEDPGKYHIYVEDKIAPNLSQWAAQFYKVFGDNGMIAICHYMASIYRDFFMDKYSCFPLLNLFGPQGSGKSFMAQRLNSMFGLKRSFVDVNRATSVAIARRAAQICNGYAFFDEYSFKTDESVDAAMKNFYDGISRSKGDKSNSNKTNTTPVFASVVLSGQVLPARDPALLERCVTLFFSPMIASAELKQEAKKLSEWEDGRLSQVTAYLHTLRAEITSNFDSVQDDMMSTIESLVSPDTKTRVLYNYSILATVYSIVSKKIAMPFKLGHLLDYIAERIEEQSNSVSSSNEVYIFWNLFSFLLSNKLIGPHDDYICKLKKEIRVADNKDISTTIEYEQPVKVLYIQLNKIHGLYKEHGRKQGEDRLLARSSLKFYLQKHPSYIGRVKAVKFGDKAHRCYAFRASLLPIEVALTDFSQEEIDNAQGEMKFNAPTADNNPFNEVEEVA